MDKLIALISKCKNQFNNQPAWLVTTDNVRCQFRENLDQVTILQYMKYGIQI